MLVYRLVPVSIAAARPRKLENATAKPKANINEIFPFPFSASTQGRKSLVRLFKWHIWQNTQAKKQGTKKQVIIWRERVPWNTARAADMTKRKKCKRINACIMICHLNKR